jgi:hypothetical protein
MLIFVCAINPNKIIICDFSYGTARVTLRQAGRNRKTATGQCQTGVFTTVEMGFPISLEYGTVCVGV